MKISEVVKKEERFDEDALLNIHFYKEGEWCRGYEWSAFLIHNYPNGLETKLKPNHKMLNDGTDFIYVGLKFESFKKYLPDIDIEPFLDKKEFTIKVPNDAFGVLGFNFDNYSKFLNDWKKGYEISNKDKKDASTIETTDKNEVGFSDSVQHYL